MAARVAAVRETIEEAGIAVGLDPLPDPDALGRLRSGLNAHGSFADLLANEGLALDPDALIPFARWCPRLAHVRIFDTRFYLARLQIGRPPCGESVCQSVWVPVVSVTFKKKKKNHT